MYDAVQFGAKAVVQSPPFCYGGLSCPGTRRIQGDCHRDRLLSPQAPARSGRRERRPPGCVTLRLGWRASFTLGRRTGFHSPPKRARTDDLGLPYGADSLAAAPPAAADPARAPPRAPVLPFRAVAARSGPGLRAPPPGSLLPRRASGGIVSPLAAQSAEALGPALSPGSLAGWRLSGGPPRPRPAFMDVDWAGKVRGPPPASAGADTPLSSRSGLSSWMTRSQSC